MRRQHEQNPPRATTAIRRRAVAGRLLVDGQLVPGAVVVDGDRIVEVRVGERHVGALPAPRLDAEIVSPGLVDLQVNGGFGLEVGGDAAALRALAARLPSTGVTTFLPTVVSAAPRTTARWRRRSRRRGRRRARACRACTWKGRCWRRRGRAPPRGDRRGGRDPRRRARRAAGGRRRPAGDARARTAGRAGAHRRLRARASPSASATPTPPSTGVAASTPAPRWSRTSTARCRRSPPRPGAVGAALADTA